jgi:antitoxin YefM
MYDMTYKSWGIIMKVITASDLRANLANAFDAIENDAEDLVVTRSGHEPLVVMLKSDYDAWRETEYLSRGANGRELRRRMAEMEAGERVEHELAGTDAEPPA